MENNIFTGKTVDEAIAEGLETLKITLADAEIEVLEEGKKKIFGSVKAQVRITKKQSDAQRAAEFVNGLLPILGISGNCEIVSEGDNICLEIKTDRSARVIGKRGDVLDAIQCVAGAVANIGKDEYKKVVVDCENYRAQREATLKSLAEKMAAKAVETGKKLMLEPMNPYERRIIHAALADNSEVKTISEGKEPARYIVVIPNNAKPYDKPVRFGERRDRDSRRGFDRRDNGGKRFERRDGDSRRGGRSGGGAKRGKKEIHFGTYLGNSKDN